MNVFRRFAAEPAKMAAFYSEVIGLKQLPSLNMPGGGQMMLFQIGSGQVKLQYTAAFGQGRGGKRMAMVLDPANQWVELVVVPGASQEVYDTIELGMTVSDLETSRAFYREFVGLDELPPVQDPVLGVTRYPYRHGTTTVTVWSFGKGLAANTRSAGIQYVVSDVEAVDVKAKAQNVKIDTPLGNFSAGLRTIWLSDPDGITNYFAQIIRRAPAPSAA